MSNLLSEISVPIFSFFIGILFGMWLQARFGRFSEADLEGEE